MKRQNKDGFTIIEVVLVLAIAGLIFMMVFVALPALQRSQRDTQRREDMGRFVSQLTQYQTNNQGKVPINIDGYNNFIDKYLKAEGGAFADPAGGDYVIPQNGGLVTCSSTSCVNKSAGQNADKNTNHIYIYTNATCDGENPTFTPGDRRIAVTIRFEGSAGSYCAHN